jgi:hypothetical protein
VAKERGHFSLAGGQFTLPFCYYVQKVLEEALAYVSTPTTKRFSRSNVTKGLLWRPIGLGNPTESVENIR